MSLWNFGRSPEATSKALLLGEALRVGPTGLPTPSAPPFGTFFGIFGVGLMFQKNVVVAVVLMDDKQVGKSFEPVSLLSVQSAKNALDVLFGQGAESWATNVFALGITAPELHVSPADDVMAPNPGTCGSHVRWGNSQGLLTAGHVGSLLLSAAYSKGTQIGQVVFSCNPANTGAQVGADVALIELNHGVPLITTITGTAQVEPTNNLLVMNRNRQQVQVMGKANWLTIPSANGTYGEIYFTMGGVTQAGDSGAAVLLQGTQRVIGHVVGGSTGMTSYIQDIDYQLQAIRSSSTFASVAI